MTAPLDAEALRKMRLEVFAAVLDDVPCDPGDDAAVLARQAADAYCQDVAALLEENERLRRAAGDEEELQARFVNALLEKAPDSWDDDVSGDAIAERYLRHLEAEVQRVGGCRHPVCWWANGEPCDHGYLPEPVEPSSERDRLARRVSELEQENERLALLSIEAQNPGIDMERVKAERTKRRDDMVAGAYRGRDGSVIPRPTSQGASHNPPAQALHAESGDAG